MANLADYNVLQQGAFLKVAILAWALGVLLLFELAEAQPANFVFGDSLVEVGNNNFIQTLSRADYVPNGIDFGRPTGRFTNGRTVVDIIGQKIGLKDYTPPYLAPTTRGTVILKGVNYASGGAGILNETGALFVGRINMDAQLDNFANTKQDIIAAIGAEAGEELIQNALYSVTMASNDFINNYLIPLISKPKQILIPPETFVASLIARFRTQLTRLFNMGGRKIVVLNVGPIGCIPYVRDTNPSSGSDGCVEFSNWIVGLFNTQLRGLVAELSHDLQGSKFLYGDINHIVNDIIRNHVSYGFDVADSACCYVEGRHGGIIPCSPASKYCPDRSKYVFWDPYHPTDAANVLIAKRLLDGDVNDISPININQLLYPTPAPAGN